MREQEHGPKVLSQSSSRAATRCPAYMPTPVRPLADYERRHHADGGPSHQPMALLRWLREKARILDIYRVLMSPRRPVTVTRSHRGPRDSAADCTPPSWEC